MGLESKHYGKDLIAAVNRWGPGTKATSTFLNECAASNDFLWSPPEQGSGKWKMYNDVHLLEFGMQCAFKAMSLPRQMSKMIVKELRKETSYHKSKSTDDLDKRLSGYKLVIKNSKHFESVYDFGALKKVIDGDSGVTVKRNHLAAEGPASHALVIVPEVILKALVG